MAAVFSGTGAPVDPDDLYFGGCVTTPPKEARAPAERFSLLRGKDVEKERLLVSLIFVVFLARAFGLGEASAGERTFSVFFQFYVQNNSIFNKNS